MPVVNIKAWPMDNERKADVIKNITKVFTDLGIPSMSVTIIIDEVSKENWGSEGVQHSIKFKDIG